VSSGWQSCGSGNCVEISIGPFDVVVRNSTDRLGPFVSFNHTEWADFLAAVGNGEHRLPGDSGVTRVELHREIARLAEQVEQLRAALRHPSTAKGRSSIALDNAIQRLTDEAS
jgi:Domain of unknown function (DUF397)